MSSGYGRGGRGAALLEARMTPTRKPGQASSPPHSGSGDGPSLAPTAPQAAASLPPVGRGVMLHRVMQEKQVKEASALARQPQQPDLPKSFGRGQLPGVGLGRSAAVLTPAAPSGSTGPAQPVIRSMGRGLTCLNLTYQSATGQPSPQPVSTSAQARAPVAPMAAPVAVAAAVAPIRQPAAHPTESRAPPEEGRVSMLEHMMRNMELDTPSVDCRGTAGDVLPLAANYIRLTAKNQEGVYQYAVSFRPEVDSMAIRHRLVRELADITGPTKCFDGAILFLPVRLPQQESIGKVSTHEGTEVTVTIKLVKVVPHRSCTQLYNVLFHNIMTILKMCPVGRQYYDPHRPTSVPQHKLEVWPGYVTSIKEFDGGLMLLTDVSHKVLRTETVLDLIQDAYSTAPRAFHETVEKKIIGATVLTRYNNKTYRVDEVDWEKSPTDTFETKNGPVSFIDYYRSAYGKTIRDPRQPMLVHRPSKKEQRMNRGRTDLILLVPELCNTTGLTDEMRSDFRVMKDLAAHTRVTPEQRQASLRKFCENVNSQPEARQELEKWGLHLENDLIKLDGRVLQREKIFFSNTEVDSGRKADWSNAAVSNGVIAPVDLKNWVIIYISRDEQRVTGFLRTLEQVVPSLGMRFTRPVTVPLSTDRTEHYTKAIRSNLNPQVQLVVTICPTRRDDRYNAIKRLCYREVPVASQVIQSKTIGGDQRKLKSIVQKIALQINCKLGGELWAVRIPVEGMMVVGIDSYHAVGRKSIGGFVASMNNTCTRWFSRVCHQMEGQELVDGLKMCLTAAIRQYYKENHKPPDRIMIYRDGVGDGDLQYVTGHEVAQLQSCFASFGEAYQPKMAVIVVQKRINTRVFLRTGGGPRTRLDNPPPGTILDHCVTRRELYDFFLVSQHVNQGTVTPTHYIVVHDSSEWKVDNIQKLTYKLTHLYYNWPGTIRVPAPCQYAHRLAYLVGQNLGGSDPSPELSTTLFFL